MELPADPAGELGDAALDRHVDVLVAVGEREAALAELALDLVERGVQLVALLAEMIPCAASIDACARDCWTSYGPRRQSNDSESLSARKAAS